MNGIQALLKDDLAVMETMPLTLVRSDTNQLVGYPR